MKQAIKPRCSHILFCWLLLGLVLPAPLEADPTPSLTPTSTPLSAPVLVIIIDDIGNNLASGLRAVQLPGKLNLAILPHTPSSVELAQRAAAAGKEVILHTPMSNYHHRPMGPGALTEQMNEQEFRQALINNIRHMPHIRGVSNHMGSRLTSMLQPMEWVMQELAPRNLYFVDSRTSHNTLAANIAGEHGIPHLSRQVFLDNDASPSAIHRQFRKLLARADSEGLGIAIGHPYPETLDYLQHALPALSASGYRLALVSEVLSNQNLISQRQGP
jgi:polysaccharide deacetylase 2 family uncharacterized protein YibQ